MSFLTKGPISLLEERQPLASTNGAGKISCSHAWIPISQHSLNYNENESKIWALEQKHFTCSNMKYVKFLKQKCRQRLSEQNLAFSRNNTQNHKWNHIKLKIFCRAMETSHGVTRKAAEWGKICSYSSDKGIIFRI